MNVQKSCRIGVWILVGIFLVSLIGTVSAADAQQVGEATRGFFEETFSTFGSFLEGIFGETGFVGGDGVSKILFGIILAMFVYSAIGSFFSDLSKTQPWIQWVAAIAISILGILGIPEGFISSLAMNYGAMGAAILAMVPFLVIFWFSMSTKNLLMARGVWLFYTIYYFGMAINGAISAKVSGTGDGAVWAYWIAVLAGAVMFFLILKVHNFIMGEKLKASATAGQDKIKKVGLAKELSEQMWETVSGVDTE